MLEPLTNQPNEQAQLQAEIAGLKQENTELRTSLKEATLKQLAAHQLEQRSQPDEDLQQHNRILEATAQATDALLTIVDLAKSSGHTLTV